MEVSVAFRSGDVRWVTVWAGLLQRRVCLPRRVVQQQLRVVEVEVGRLAAEVRRSQRTAMESSAAEPSPSRWLYRAARYLENNRSWLALLQLLRAKRTAHFRSRRKYSRRTNLFYFKPQVGPVGRYSIVSLPCAKIKVCRRTFPCQPEVNACAQHNLRAVVFGDSDMRKLGIGDMNIVSKV